MCVFRVLATGLFFGVNVLRAGVLFGEVYGLALALVIFVFPVLPPVVGVVVVWPVPFL